MKEQPCRFRGDATLAAHNLLDPLLGGDIIAKRYDQFGLPVTLYAFHTCRATAKPSGRVCKDEAQPFGGSQPGGVGLRTVRASGVLAPPRVTAPAAAPALHG